MSADTTPKRNEAVAHPELPAVDYVRSLLELEPVTGVLRWKVRASRVAAPGSIAGAMHHQGYIRVFIKRKSMPAHYIVWALIHGCWPPDGFEIDHINGHRSDNRPSNLRVSTRTGNCINTKLRKDNTSGYKGVFLEKRTGKWLAQIGVNRKVRRLGKFTTKEAAHDAYCAAAKEIYGDFFDPNYRTRKEFTLNLEPPTDGR